MRRTKKGKKEKEKYEEKDKTERRKERLTCLQKYMRKKNGYEEEALREENDKKRGTSIKKEKIMKDI